MRVANRSRRWFQAAIAVPLAGLLASCGRTDAAGTPNSAAAQVPEVGVVKVARRNLERNLVVSSELVPFQQIDVYAKEAGFVQKLSVDYGTHVKTGEVMAVLEIPELEVQLQEDAAAIKDAMGQADRAQKDRDRVQAEETAIHLQYSRLNQVAKSRPGLVAQQEVDDWLAKDSAAAAQVSAATGALQSAQSQLTRAQAALRRDQVIYNYSKITAPFNGVVTKRYANFGTLMQAATSSSAQVLPLVQLSEDDKFRLVIPVPEEYAPYIRIGNPVQVRVVALNRSFPGTVARISVDVEEETRTMHTEVDVPNSNRLLMPGMFAEATLTFDRRNQALAVPPEAISSEGDKSTAWVVDAAGLLRERNVTVGIETPTEVEVVAGLTEGEQVVVGDRSGLQNGQKARPKEVRLLQYQGGQPEQ
ncbi:MAG TPA: efflux RND transporter periplasmic adaptor subunit, partial [Candidatus Sulfopaludibacter sp.]|nr:efflux RND transporter periplasmic adaptor subunit [Candidatus Sulfopaludibacter sp.]